MKATVSLAGVDEPVAQYRASMPAPRGDRRPTRHETDAAAIFAAVTAVLAQVLADARAKGVVPERIAVSTQMHSVLMTDAQDAPLTPMVSWQDDRLSEIAASGVSRLDSMLEQVPEELRHRAGIARRPGFGAGNLAALLEEAEHRPRPGSRIHTLGSFIASSLGGPYATHRSSAASLGLLDVERGDWSEPLRGAYGLEDYALPEVHDGFQAIGSVSFEELRLDWFPDLGDHQASVLGGGGLSEDEFAVSLGTAGIAARWSRNPSSSEHVDSRPYPGGGYLLAVSRLPGGRLAGRLDAFVGAVAADLGVKGHEPGSLLTRLSDSEDAAAAPDSTLRIAEESDEGGGRRLVIRGVGGASGGVTALRHALVSYYGERYRAAVGLLYPDGSRPSRLRLNGGLAMSSPWFRDRFADELSAEVADYPERDLALEGLRILLDRHDAERTTATDHPARPVSEEPR